MPEVSYLASPRVTREVLEQYGLATKHALGQNFLINDAIIAKICALSEVGNDDVVLEVGPGIGTLTVALLPRAEHVISVERDRDLPPVLADTCGEFDNFTLVSKDALELLEKDFAGLQPTKFIANLPYAVAATLVLDFLQRFDSIQSVTVMVQREVADRMMASMGTKDYGAYTIKLNLFARPAGRFPVSPNNFFPPPRVDSAVIRLNRVKSDVAPEVIRAACVAADAAFASRRKTIANSMKMYFASRGNNIEPDCELAKVLEEASIDFHRRGESLSLDEFKILGAVLLNHGYVA